MPADATLAESEKDPLLATVAVSTPTARMGIRTQSFQLLLEDFPCTQLNPPNPHTIAGKILAPLFWMEL